MSGGSLNYVYNAVEEAAFAIRCRAETTLHHAFADHLVKVSKALHDLEWVFSADYGPGREVEAIKAALPADAEITTLIARGEATLAELQRLLAEAKISVGGDANEPK